MSNESDTPKDAKARAKADKVYQKASRPWSKKKRFWLLGIVGVAVVGQALSGGGDSPETSSNDSGQQEQNQAATETSSNDSVQQEQNQTTVAITPIAVTAEQLISDLKENALAAKTSWNEKLVTVTGTLSNIDASGDYFILRGDEEYEFIDVRISIDDSFVAVVSAFKMGQSVTVTGIVSDVGEIMGYDIKAQSIP
jgi:hypothetical protein